MFPPKILARDIGLNFWRKHLKLNKNIKFINFLPTGQSRIIYLLQKRNTNETILVK